MTVGLLGAAPAEAETDPTTLSVDGTLQVIAVDTFGDDADDARADHLYAVVTDDGAEIPIALDDEEAANGRFTGELVVAGAVASALDDKDLLPKAGSTIDEDTRAGRAAVAAAEDQTTPLTVASSTVAPAKAAAVTTPAAHQVYVAVLDNRGSVEETDAQVSTIVDSLTDYWVTESAGVISSFAIQGTIKHFSSSSAGTTAQSCGMASPSAVWNEAKLQFPGVSFSTSSRNHLFVAMADECGDAGIAGVASVGNNLSSGGPMSFSMGSIASQVGVHEIGHTFGLGHSNLATCSGDCEYFDLYSPMALAVSGATFSPASLGSLYRSRLGLTTTSEVSQVSLTSAQTELTQSYTLAPRSGSAGLRGLVVTDPASGVKYSVDLRNRTARDAGTFYGSQYTFASPLPTYPSGVVIEREDAGGDTALMTDTPISRATGAFKAGRTFSPSAGLAVTVETIGSTAVVTVRLGSASASAPASTPAPAAATPAAVAPTVLAAKTPRITGTARVGKTVKVKVGSWSPRPSYRYQWYANGKKITKKATKSSFKLTSKQKGKRITVKVTGRKTGYTTVTKTSAKTKKVATRK